MTARIGEYALARYRKHPPPGSTAPLANGKPWDAGTIIWFDSNVSWLVKESVRHLVSEPGPGSQSVFADATKVYDNVVDIVPPDSGAITFIESMEITWERNTAVRLGPFPVVCDEQGADGDWLPRQVRVDVQTTFTVSSLKLYFALTTNPDEVALYENNQIAFTTDAPVASGRTRVTLTPDVRIPQSAAERWKCRRNSTPTSSLVAVIPIWLWVGWRPIDAGAGTCSIDSISAWETR